MEVALYVGISTVVFTLISALVLLSTRPDRQETQRAEEIAPDARYDIRVQKVFLGVSVTLGLVASIFRPLVGSQSINHLSKETLFSVTACIATWAYLTALTLFSVCSIRPHVVFHVVCHIAGLSLLQLGYSIIVTADTIHNTLTGRVPISKVLAHPDVLFSLLLVAASAILFISSLNVPRGPPLEYKDKPVISLAFSTLYSQMVFSYVEGVKAISRNNQALKLDDLPSIPYELRASTMMKKFSSTRGKGSFTWRLFHALKVPFILQWVLAITQGLLTYTPAFFLLKILDFISSYQDGVAHGQPMSIYPGIGWVFGMFVVKMLGTIVDTQTWYIGACVLQVTSRAAINLDIYDKTLRKQNTTGESTTPEALRTVGSGSSIDDSVGSKNDTDKESGENDAHATSKQNVLNLMTVDADRISTFFVFNFFGIQAPVEVIVALVFLYQLVGWAAIPGFLVICLFIPLTSVTSKLYSTTQDRLMSARDKRVGLINELLQGIRQIKFQANEKYYMAKAQDVRNKELRQLMIAYAADVAIDISYKIAPVAISVVTFAVYATFIADLTPSIAFTSLVIMNQLRFSVNFIPEIIVETISVWTSVKRIGKYLESEEVAAHLLESPDSEASEALPIVLEDACFKFAGSKQEEDAFTLQNISAEFPVGELSLISGSTGSGKTLLLIGILGEAHLARGKVQVPRSVLQTSDIRFIPAERWIQKNTIAYVAQSAWLENKSIQQNVLFGAPLVDARYQETLEVCGLAADLKILEDGDQTEIGEKGINLSGGQKARVSLARAVYSRASVIIMDDVLSALDAHIAKHVFEKCINGPIMNGRTRILVTHQISLCLNAANYVLALEDGTIKHVGFVSELKRSGSLQDLIAQEKAPDITEAADEAAVVDETSAVDPSKTVETPVAANVTKAPRKLVDEETTFRGNVPLKLYLRYLRSQGSLLYFAFIVTLFTAELALATYGTYWIRLWSSTVQESDESRLTIFRSQIAVLGYTIEDHSNAGKDHSITYWVGFYLLLMLSSQLISLAGTALEYWACIHAGRTIYTRMLGTIMRAPLRFLDTVPTGRLLNRFSKDAETVDSKIGRSITFLLKESLKAMLILIICVTVQPFFLVAAAVLVAIGLWIGASYVTATRALKRLDSVNRSPMYETFSTTLAGITTIRAYGASDRFLRSMFDRVDNVTNTQFHNMVVNRWLGFRFDALGTFYTVGVACFLLYNLDMIDAGLAGFTMSFAMELQDALSWTIRFYAELEQNMNAVERMFEYTDVETEAAHESEPGKAPPAAWPTEGSIEFKNLELKYAPVLPSVLHKISFTVKPHEKVGIIGRTGSGKTTITLALFRFLEAHHGSISIDGLDISKMGLNDLRSRLTIVPQEPTLFQGTLRSNLSDEATDAELREVLRRVHLSSDHTSGTSTPSRTANRNVFDNLDYAVTESGSNFSAGQRQLLCLARALLRRTKIIIMDEATASVDVETDALIQETIRSEFIDSTVLTIAHRLATIIDYDRILVLDSGNVLEFDTPAELLKNEESQFSKMVKAAKLDVPETVMV